MQKMINCANCGRAQRDEGTGKTCPICGCSPLPSYQYPKKSAFYPRDEETQQSRIERSIAQKRAALGR